MTERDPTFIFGIGLQKAGTTWLANYFREHPDIHMTALKEMHYFDALWSAQSRNFPRRWRRVLEQRLEDQRARDAVSDITDPADAEALRLARDIVHIYDTPDASHGVYRAFMLRDRVSEACVADITPSYCMLAPEHLQEILRVFAPARFFLVLRDPVARMWSQIKMHCANRVGKAGPFTPEDIIAGMLRGEFGSILSRSAMADTLRALGTLPAACTKVMFYETMFNDTQMRDFCDFLGVGFVPGQYDDRINHGAQTSMTDAQHATLRWLNGPTYRAIHDMIGDDIPDTWDMTAMTAPCPGHVEISDVHDSILQGRMI